MLEIISRGETYGYEIASSLRTLGFADVFEGTVYTILLRLEKNKLVDIEKAAVQYGLAQRILSAERGWSGRTRNLLGEMGLRLTQDQPAERRERMETP